MAAVVNPGECPNCGETLCDHDRCLCCQGCEQHDDELDAAEHAADMAVLDDQLERAGHFINPPPRDDDFDDRGGDDR